MTWVILGVAALIIGISKTSIAGFGSLAVALFALAMPTKESTAAVLLLLIVGDLVAVRRYRHHCDWRLLVGLLPWVVPGLALGAWLLHAVSDDRLLRRIIGGLLAVSLVIQIVQRWRAARQPTVDEPPTTPTGRTTATERASSAVAGTAAGFTTMTANAAGPVMTLYLLAARVDKMKFVGTGAWYFLIVNLCKVPFSAALHLFPKSTLVQDLVLAPIVLLGTWIGVHLLGRLSQRWFEWLAIASSVVAVALLLIR